jgi:GT2 family glycosyltransferase
MAHSLGVVVNQRDRYDWHEALIAALYQDLPAGTPVLFVDGGSPPALRDVLQRSAEQWGLELLRCEAFISANQARLLALERLSVSYLLCVENDVRLAPGCAEALVAAAERQRADVVVPLVLEENDLGRQRIHLAGGTCRLRWGWASSWSCVLRIQCQHSMLQRSRTSCSRASGVVRRLVRNRCWA